MRPAAALWAAWDLRELVPHRNPESEAARSLMMLELKKPESLESISLERLWETPVNHSENHHMKMEETSQCQRFFQEVTEEPRPTSKELRVLVNDSTVRKTLDKNAS